MTDSTFFKKGIYIFNPDTDFALASGSKFYTPPASVISLRQNLALTPALYAPEESIILLLDSPDIKNSMTDLVAAAERKNIGHVSLRELSSLPDDMSDNIYPWGWNQQIRHTLAEAGIPESKLPTEETIERIRNLSHRRISIEANRYFNKVGLCSSDTIPQEITYIDQLDEFLKRNPYGWFKAPWSSSGRGVISGKELYPNEIYQWVKGTIRRQKSVLAETPADSQLDFATEWISSDLTATFAGFSVFKTSSRGKFKGNISASQSDLKKIIESCLSVNLDTVIKFQKEFIEEFIAKDYVGPLGIDMIACKDGTLRPCVEINLRMTMGLANAINSMQS